MRKSQLCQARAARDCGRELADTVKVQLNDFGFVKRTNLIRHVIDQVMRESEVMQRRHPCEELVRERRDLIVRKVQLSQQPALQNLLKTIAGPGRHSSMVTLMELRNKNYIMHTSGGTETSLRRAALILEMCLWFRSQAIPISCQAQLWCSGHVPHFTPCAWDMQ